jgi:hypothetical protein
MEQRNQQPPGGQQSFPQTNQQEKQLITILGVQGLSYQNYSVVELKIVLQIIKHAQKAILGYVIPYHVTPQTFSNFTVEQRAAGHTDVTMKLSEFSYGYTVSNVGPTAHPTILWEYRSVISER